MTKSFFAAAFLASLALASPVPEAEPEAQLSLPPLIPTIPGVTEPLTSNAPPLPILQIPTPPLVSPPFTGSDIKPKKIGYFWTAAGDTEHAGEYLSIFGNGIDTNLTLRLLGCLQSRRCKELTLTCCLTYTYATRILLGRSFGLQTYLPAATALTILVLAMMEKPSLAEVSCPS